jgi:hypothetical protein
VVEIAKVLDRPVATRSDVRDLTAKFDENPSPVDWGSDAIYFTAYQKTQVGLFRVNPQTEICGHILLLPRTPFLGHGGDIEPSVRSAGLPACHTVSMPA